MARWHKVLARMLKAGRAGTGFHYREAASVLKGLGFQVAPTGGGSHRMWRGKSPRGTSVIVGLVEKGAGDLKPYLVRDMLDQLSEHGFLDDLQPGSTTDAEID